MAAPPAADEVEVSLFGPGFGESVVVHLGDGRWIVVDSCIDHETKDVVPLRYLDSMGVPGSEVQLVVATHWHDDHVRGMADIVQETPDAPFIIPAALSKREFTKLVMASAESMMESGGADEFNDVLQVLALQGRGPKHAMADRTLLDESGSRGQCRVKALSPSDDSFDRAIATFAALLPEYLSGTKRRIPDIVPNHTSTVLLVEIGEVTILLGSDLEASTHAGSGWLHVLDGLASQPPKAAVFKVAHHGSKTGDEPRVWDEIVDPQPLAILTPWSRGGRFLPQKDDVERICARATRSFITAAPGRPRKKTHHRAVDRTLRESGLKVIRAERQVGHVRLRLKSGSRDWEVRLSKGARQLT